MALGSVKTVLICAPSGAITVSPCPSGQSPAAVEAYVLEPSAASFLEAVTAPFDYAQGSAYWATAFVFTLSLYIFTRIYGSIINMTR